ncbi:hypothetical protein ACFLTA_06655 [Bacteroidota bacterium]
MKTVLGILSMLIMISACDKESINPNAGKNVEFYLLDNDMTDIYDMAISPDIAILNDSVLIGYDDIISYNLKTYDFKVSGDVMERLNSYEAFAVTVDKEVIYTGYFWTSISSRIVNTIVIDLVFTEENTLHVQLGYPGLMDGMTIQDKRNDPRILDVLRRDKKLIE